jgi:hypothetical protein
VARYGNKKNAAMRKIDATTHARKSLNAQNQFAILPSLTTSCTQKIMLPEWYCAKMGWSPTTSTERMRTAGNNILQKLQKIS